MLLKKKIKCPYCNKPLEKKPIKKKKCPFCGKYIYVRKGMLYTEDNLKEYEEEMAKEAEKNRIEYLLDKIGFTYAEFQNRKKAFQKKSETKPHYIDIIMSLFNEKTLRIRDFDVLQSKYYDMALILNEENKPCHHLLRLSNKMKLMSLRKQGYEKVRILSGGGCEDCKKLDGKTYTIEEALKSNSLPNKNCTHKLYNEKESFCKCMYEPVIPEI